MHVNSMHSWEIAYTVKYILSFIELHFHSEILSKLNTEASAGASGMAE